MITRKKRSTLDRGDFSSEPVGLIGIALRRACIWQQMATDTGSDQPARPLNNLVRGMRKGSTAPVGRHRRRLFVALMLWCLLLGVNSPGQAPDPGQDLRVAGSLMSGADGVVDYPSAAMFLRRAASQGSFDAEGLLGKLYLRGEGVPRNLAKANQRIQASAAGGSAIGQTYLALMLMNGWYLKRDPVRARRLLEKVYNRYPPALTLLGRLYLTGAGGKEHVQKAIECFMRAAEAGDADGEFRLGEMYLLGLGVQQDSERAAIWLGKAAAQDDPDAQFRLGKMYAQGTGVDRDPRRALQLFVAAARHRYVPAEMVLGERDTFLRSPRFWPRAAYWFSLAAKGGSRRGGSSVQLAVGKNERAAAPGRGTAGNGGGNSLLVDITIRDTTRDNRREQLLRPGDWSPPYASQFRRPTPPAMQPVRSPQGKFFGFAESPASPRHSLERLASK